MDNGLVSLEAEKAVVGALLLDPTKTREAIQHVAPGDFHSNALAGLYGLITTKHATGESIDPLTVWADVQADPALMRNVKSAAMLQDLMHHTPTAENVGYYARQVADAGQSRRLMQYATRLNQIAGDMSMPATEKLNIARQEIEHIASEYSTAIDIPTLEEVLAVEDSHDWVIPGLFERMDRLVVTGGEGLGKSTFLRQLAILSAGGIHPTRFYPIDPVRVTIVDAENTERQWRRNARGVVERVRHVTGRSPAGDVRLYCTGRLDITQERDLAKLHSILDQYPTDILMIGPLYKLIPRGLNSEEDASQVIAGLDVLRERGVCLLMEAHAGKATGIDGTRIMAPRGSSALLGWPEFGIGLSWDTQGLQPGDTPVTANLARWRGDRELGRHIPEQISKGGFWEWMAPDIPKETKLTKEKFYG